MIAPHLGRYLRFLALAALTAGLVGAVGYLPTRNLAGEPGVAAMVLALALCWAASAFGGVPVLLAEAALAAPAPGDRAEPKLPVVVALGSMLVRLIAVLGFGLAAAFAGLVPQKPLLLWIAIGYLALLGVDTWYVLATARGSAPEGVEVADMEVTEREVTEEVTEDATSKNVTERS